MLTEVQRQQTLAAMGIDVYVARTVGAASSTPEATHVDLVVVCAAAVAHAAATQCLRRALPLALRCAPVRIAWISTATDGALGPVPDAAAYLALGQTLTHALAEHAATAQQNNAVIAVADEPAIGLRDSLSRRALWQILKPIARALRTATE